jgi:hypothetical protein
MIDPSVTASLYFCFVRQKDGNVVNVYPYIILVEPECLYDSDLAYQTYGSEDTDLVHSHYSTWSFDAKIIVLSSPILLEY